ncbi:hypothetical protein BMS3Bbin01_02062 [bacterium BMS3Bbin01]|nr:hypothetical protein BMS3Bbin01_02062 [bacterium BMS3Bbin01]
MAGNGPTERPEEQWHAARLIPVVGIRSAKEQEQRATSALLAVMGIVPSFGKALLSYLNAPAGRISTFTEVHFEDDDGTAIPDGAIIVERGKTRWVCLVEVKTRNAELTSEQVNRYMKIAVANGFDAVLTISNQIVSSPDALPFKPNKRLLNKLKAVRHLSWFRIFTEAVIKNQHHGVSDPEQAWILGQLVDYLDSEKSGAGGFEGMGADWVAVKKAARQRTLRPGDKGIGSVAADWVQFVEYLCLGLRQKLIREVTPVYPKASDAKSRFAAHCDTLGARGDHKLKATVRVPDAVGHVNIEADLVSRQVTTSIEVKAPREGRAKTRVNWLLRQLKDAPGDARIEVKFHYSRDTTSALVADVQKSPETVLLTSDPKKEPKAFVVAVTREMGEKRGKGHGSFVAVTREQVLDFYRDVVQNLTAWQPRPPKLAEPKEAEEKPEAAPQEPTPGVLPIPQSELHEAPGGDEVAG